VQKSYRFSPERGQVVAVIEDGVVFARLAEQRHFYPTSGDNAVRSGNFLGANPGSGPRGYTKSEWVLNGEFFHVRNFPNTPAPTVGREFDFEALRTGTYNWKGNVIEAFDYGAPHWIGIVATNGRPAFTLNTNTTSAVAKTHP
jgi:hypothetical protein